MDEKLQKIVDRMKASGVEQAVINAFIVENGGEPEANESSAPEHVALTVADASAEDISAVNQRMTLALQRVCLVCPS